MELQESLNELIEAFFKMGQSFIESGLLQSGLNWVRDATTWFFFS